MKVAGVELERARVLVMGMAKSGQAAARLLARNGARVTASDARPLAEISGAPAAIEESGAEFVLESECAAGGHDLVVLAPGVPPEAPAVDYARRGGIPVVGELELASYFLRGPVMAITGSNGKTTTTALAGHILASSGVPAQVGGNIGLPPAAMVDTSRDGQWNVLEVSSFQLETVSNFRARIGVCLNLTPDHLDRHGTMERYASAKGRLFSSQRPSDFAVLNADDALCAGFAARARSRPVWFSLLRAVRPGAWAAAGGIILDGEPLMRVSEIPLRGTHNTANALAAAAASMLAGARPGAIAEAIRTFPGVEHRLEYVRTVRGVEYFNDSKATNVDAALKAVAAFPGRLWIILGGKDKGSDYAPLREPLRQQAAAALLIGAAAPRIREQLAGPVPLIDCGTLDRALGHARREARPGDVVLLAPACASFDQFDNFEQRGRAFKALVASLEED